MTDLVGGLLQLLGVERGTETEGNTGAEEDVVGDGGNTTVVDLGLFLLSAFLFHFFFLRPQASRHRSRVESFTLAKETGSRRYLLATSRPTVFPLLEFQVALAPASTAGLTFW